MVVFSEDLWVFGIISSIGAGLFEALGENLIKLSFTRNDKSNNAAATQNSTHDTTAADGETEGETVLYDGSRLERDEKRDQDCCHGCCAGKFYCQPLWICGIICIAVLNVVLTLISYSLADESLVLPFIGLHIVFNVIFARIINQEQFTKISVVWTLLVVVGVTVVSMGGSHMTVVLTVQEMEALFGDVLFLAYTGCLILIGTSAAFSSVFASSYKIRALALGVTTGTVACFTQLWAKICAECFNELIGDSFDSTTYIQSPLPFLAPPITLTFGFIQLSLLNRLLFKYDAFVVAPLVSSVVMTLGSTYGAIFFQEYKRWDTTQYILLTVGVLCCTIGVVLLAFSHNMNSKIDKDEELQGIELETSGQEVLLM